MHNSLPDLEPLVVAFAAYFTELWAVQPQLLDQDGNFRMQRPIVHMIPNVAEVCAAHVQQVARSQDIQVHTSSHGSIDQGIWLRYTDSSISAITLCWTMAEQSHNLFMPSSSQNFSRLVKQLLLHSQLCAEN